DENGDPTDEYFKWAQIGFLTQKGIRYPLGKDAKPLYSYWNGEKLNHIQARKKIYIPAYTAAVGKTQAFEQLITFYKQKKNIELWDFDGYDHDAEGMTLEDVIINSSRSFGHAFVLKMMLLDKVGEL